MGKENKVKKNWITSGFIVLLGVLFILASMFVDFNLITIQNLNDVLLVILTIVSKSFSAIGVSLIVGFTTNKIRAYEERQKEDKQKEQLENIIISKCFLQTLSDESKRDVIANLLTPQNSTLNKHSNIKEYLDTKTDKYIRFFDINFRTNFIFKIKIYKDKHCNKFVAKYKMSYRIYKINKKFQPLKISFEKDTQIQSTVIKYDNKTLFEVKKEDYYFDGESFQFEIPDEYQNYNYLVVERIIIEKGHSHWISLNWKSFTPIDGIDYYVECRDGIIKEYYIFDDNSLYDTPDLSDDRRTLTIISSKWLDPYTGLCVIIAEASQDDDFIGDKFNHHLLS